MRKELTDKMRADMAKVQVDFLKTHYPDLLTTDYELLKKSLAEGLRGYSQEIVNVNRKVDFELLKSLQDGNKSTAVKLIHAVRAWNLSNFHYTIQDKHLMRLYKNDKEARKHIVQYGEKTSKLLSDYLTKRGLIE
jgi:hypothetical protein